MPKILWPCYEINRKKKERKGLNAGPLNTQTLQIIQSNNEF